MDFKKLMAKYLSKIHPNTNRMGKNIIFNNILYCIAIIDKIIVEIM